MKNESKNDEFTYNPVKKFNTAVVKNLDKRDIHPHFLTILSFINYMVAGVFFAVAPLWIGGIFIIAGSIFSVIDGQLAKRKGFNARINSYFESVIDRYSDIVLFIGLLFRYAKAEDLFMVFITSLALAGSILVSYTGVRQEYREKKVALGFMERGERIVIITIGAFINHMVTAMYIIAIIANLDTLLRIGFIYRHLKEQEDPE